MIHKSLGFCAVTCGLVLLWALPTAASTEEQLNKHFNVQSGGTLVIEVDFGSIDVSTNGTGEVVVEAWRKISRKSKADEEAFLRDHPVEFSRDGNTVTIKAKAKNPAKWSIWGIGSNRNEAKYKVTVPAEFNANLKTAGGPISLVDLKGESQANTSGGGLTFARLRGSLEGHTSGGPIRATDCNGTSNLGTSGGGVTIEGGSGSLSAHSSGGPISVKNFAGPAKVGTSGGGLTLENIGGDLNGSTSGGSIHATLVSPLPGEVKLSTSGGGVTVSVPGDAAFNLDASTSGGGVSCDLPVTVQGKLRREHLVGPVNGGGKAVSLHTSGGGIHVKKL